MSAVTVGTAAVSLAAAVGLLVPPVLPRSRLAAAGGSAVDVRARPDRVERLRTRWRRWRQRKAGVAATAEGVVELAEAMAAELRAGQPVPAALAAAVDAVELAVLPSSLTAVAEAGGPVAELLEAAAGARGAAGLRAVAACWRVSEHSGAGLARALEGVAVGLRDECDVVREIAGQLAAPRATGRLLALLPVVGWVMGATLGARPVAVLLTTPYGWVCLALGVPLQVAGWWWVERLTAAADPWRR